jgi:hypothetical protein
MREALSKVLQQTQHTEEEHGQVDRILAAAFYRGRPLQAGSSAKVVCLTERRTEARPFLVAEDRS